MSSDRIFKVGDRVKAATSDAPFFFKGDGGVITNLEHYGYKVDFDRRNKEGKIPVYCGVIELEAE